MKAIFNQEKHQDNAVDHGIKKERIHQIIVVDDAGSKRKVIDCRFYMGRSSQASVVYCSVWLSGSIDGESVWLSGSGQAGGYGYHKASAAMYYAITAAGFDLVEDDGVTPSHIVGRGDEAMRDAAIALASALGYDDVILVE